METSARLAATQSVYRPDIDGLRAFAALAVLGVHAGVVPGGFIGVDVFFVISGYLISGLILRDLRRNTFTLVDFYSRRTRRIFPALLTVLVAALAIGWCTNLSDEFRSLGRSISDGALFVRNISMYFQLGAGNHNIAAQGALGHLWSLGVEEQFYLLWPLFLQITWRWGKWQILLITFLTVVSFVLNLHFASRGPMIAYFLPWTRLWQLSLGAGLAHLEQTLESEDGTFRATLSLPNRPWANILGIIGSALLVASCLAFDSPAPFPGWGALAPTIGALLSIAAGQNSWINRHLFGAAPMVSVGLISYPLYLWHAPMLELRNQLSPHPTALVTTAAVTAAFLLSLITFKYVETPVRYSQGPASRTAAVLCLALFACGILGLLISREVIPARTESIQVQQFVAATTEDWLPGTHGSTWTRTTPYPLSLGNRSRYVLYIGDSNIQQYYPRISRLLLEHPRNTQGAVFDVHDWCTPVETDMSRFDAGPSCREFSRKAFERAKDTRVQSVVIGACWRCYFVSFDDLMSHTGHVNVEADRALNYLELQVMDLISKGKRVYLVLGVPVGNELDPRSSIRRTVWTPGFRVQVTAAPTRKQMGEVMQYINGRLNRIGEVTGAVVIDPMQWLCDKRYCRVTSASGNVVYHDWFNLNPSYVREEVTFLDATILDTQDVQHRGP